MISSRLGRKSYDLLYGGLVIFAEITPKSLEASTRGEDFRKSFVNSLKSRRQRGSFADAAFKGVRKLCPITSTLTVWRVSSALSNSSVLSFFWQEIG